MTLKFGLGVTQSHWKRSLKLVPFKSLGAVSYSHFIVTIAVSVAVCEIFSGVTLKTGSFKIIGNGTI